MNDFLSPFGLISAVMITFAVIAVGLPLMRGKARLTALLVALALPVTVTALYLALGTPEALDSIATAPPADAPSPEALASVLEERLAQTPEDARGWFLLGRLRVSQQQFEAAASAFERALQLQPNNADTMAELAAALMLAGGPNATLPARVVELIDRSLSAQPEQQKALWLRGMVAVQQQRYAEGLRDWERLRALLDPENPTIASLDAQIEEIRQLAAGSTQVQQPSTNGTALSITIDVSDALREQVNPRDTLFVFARDKVGGPPLAVQRVTAGQFPLTLTLDDSMRMNPNRGLADANELFVQARISRSGQALAQPGDLQSDPQSVPDDRRISLSIDQVVSP